jgi:hypothetical protein
LEVAFRVWCSGKLQGGSGEGVRNSFENSIGGKYGNWSAQRTPNEILRLEIVCNCWVSLQWLRRVLVSQCWRGVGSAGEEKRRLVEKLEGNSKANWPKSKTKNNKKKREDKLGKERKRCGVVCEL